MKKSRGNMRKILLFTCLIIISFFTRLALFSGQGTVESLPEGEDAISGLEELSHRYPLGDDAYILDKSLKDLIPVAVSSITINEEGINNASGKDQPSKTEISPIIGDKYTVKTGDTLYLIAQRANTTISNLKVLNGLSSDIIVVGQILLVKGTPPAKNNSSSASSHPTSRGSQRDEDIYWLSRIIHAEAQGEPYIGKVAVGNVILNRVKNINFPDTIHGVIFDKQGGYIQFSPVIDGEIYNNPGQDSIKAAKEALNGSRPVGEALYFLNPRKATNFWIVENRRFMKSIGDHDFYH